MKQFLFAIMFCYVTGVTAQNVGIGTTSPLSKLHVAGDVRIDSLAGHDSGVVIYDKTGLLTPLKLTGKKTDVLRGDGTFQSLDAVAAGSPYWLTTGNSEMDTSINFLGTTDNIPLRFRVNNIKAGEINNQNVMLGINALSSSQSATNIIAIGNGALQNVKYAVNTVAIGDSALFSQVDRDVRQSGEYSNTGIGSKALFSNETGVENTAIGNHSMYSLVFGRWNVAIGDQSLASNSASYGNVAIGGWSMGASSGGGNDNVAIGTQTLYANKGNANIAIGNYALKANNTGDWNTTVGIGAMAANTDGKWNTALGGVSLNKNITGTENTAVGFLSLQNNTVGNRNTAAGVHALAHNVDGSDNTSDGFRSLFFNISGSANVANGYKALLKNSTGSSNVGVGYQALFENTTGVSNTAIGTQALYNNISGVNNTAAGYGSLKSNVTGFQNTAIGMYADVTADDLFNATAIGYNAKVNASNKVRIGNAAVTKIEGQVPFSTPSDGRFKFNVKEDVIGLAFIMKLRPVTYQFDVSRFDETKNTNNIIQTSYNEAAAVRRTGFIAQEVEKAAEQSHYNFSGINKPESERDHYSLSYEAFVVPLVKGMQEQQMIIVNMRKELAAQKEINIRLLNALNAMQQEINTIKSYQNK